MIQRQDIDPADLVTLRDFTATFWKVYREGEYRCQEDVFYLLDDIYYERFGEHRFVSFDAFRVKRNRSLKKNRRR